MFPSSVKLQLIWLSFTPHSLILNAVIFQVLCSAMIIREDADIGLVVVGDIHKKNKCAQLRLNKAIDFLTSLRQTQLVLL